MNAPVLIVTGASSGIGAATARRMAREGFRITLAARREERLHSLADEVEQLGGEALVAPTDVNVPDDLGRLVQCTLDRWGRVDILFNNAGVAYDTNLEKMPREKIQAEVQTNLTSLILAAQAVLPVMLRQKSGHIINNSSLNGLVATPYNPVYCATKFGVVGFSDSLRRGLRGTGVRVSVFCPGNTPSELTVAHHAHAKGLPYAPKITGLMPTAYVADQVAGLIRRPHRMAMVPKLWSPFILLARIFPAWSDGFIKFFT